MTYITVDCFDPFRVISVAVAAVKTSVPWNVCIFAVCNQSSSCQLAQMTVTALQIFLPTLVVLLNVVRIIQNEDKGTQKL